MRRHDNRKDWPSSEQSQPGWKRPHWLKRKWNRLVLLKWRRDGYVDVVIITPPKEKNPELLPGSL